MRVTHEACPKCRELGKDKTGDNLAVYPDGGKFCFSCGYYVRGDKYTPPRTGGSVYNHFVPGEMTERLKMQLREYLDDTEIATNFKYDVVMNRAVLASSLPEFYWGKDKAQNPKVLTRGEIPFHIIGGDLGETLVVVEDPISAIAVSRIYPCLPLFGSHFPAHWLHNLQVSGYKHIVFWLDQDKGFEGLKLALSLRHLFKTHWVMTMLDPKAYSMEDMY